MNIVLFVVGLYLFLGGVQSGTGKKCWIPEKAIPWGLMLMVLALVGMSFNLGFWIVRHL